MSNYFVTFGQKYAREPHPTFPGAHPDGVLRVVAKDGADALLRVCETIGSFWAFMYNEEQITESMHFYPAGVTHVLDSDGIRAE